MWNQLWIFDKRRMNTFGLKNLGLSGDHDGVIGNINASMNSATIILSSPSTSAQLDSDERQTRDCKIFFNP